MPESQVQVLLAGTWDTTTTLLEGLGKIKETVARLPYVRDFPYDRSG
jgi:hypothetical protein